MTQIRERSHIVLWILLTFFLLSMVVGGLVGGANIMDVITGKTNTSLYIGKVGEKEIPRQRFINERERQLNQYRNQGRELDSRAYQNASDFAWNSIVERVIKDKIIEEIGLTVENDEIYDFLLLTPPQVFQDNLKSSGLFIKEDESFDMDNYQDAVRNGTLPEEISSLLVLWENYLRTYLADRKLRSLYNNTASISDIEVKDEYIKRNVNCTLDFIHVNSNNIPDSLVEVSDDDILSQFNEDKDELYTTDESQIVEYVYWEYPKTEEADSLNVSTIQDSIMQNSLLFVDEVDYSSFNEALEMFEINVQDTLNIIEGFSNNSGIPFNLGVSRPAVRFAFDNSIGDVSDPITMDNGIAVFHIIGYQPAGHKEVAQVESGIKRTLLRGKKTEYATSLMATAPSNPDEWESFASTNDYFEFVDDDTKNIGGSFSAIGKSNALTGTLKAMKAGDVSNTIKTYSSIVKIKMVSKDSLDEAKFEEEAETLRIELLNGKNAKVFNSWMADEKKKIEIEDYRSRVF